MLKFKELADVEKFYIDKMISSVKDSNLTFAKEFYDYCRRQYSRLRARARYKYYNINSTIVDPFTIINARKHLECAMVFYLRKLKKEEREKTYHDLMENSKELIFELIEKNENKELFWPFKEI